MIAREKTRKQNNFLKKKVKRPADANNAADVA